MEDSNQPAAESSSVEIAVKSCARCGHNHHTHFKPFKLQPDADYHEGYTHWGVCQVMSEPILLRIEGKAT